MTCVAAVSVRFTAEEIKKARGQAKEYALGVPKTEKTRVGGKREREGVRVTRLTPSPCSLFLAFARSFVLFACFFGDACYVGKPEEGRQYIVHFQKLVD